jgi:hypothetical protein
MTDPIDVYLETGEKRIFAGALDWPGWNRLGRSADEALQALVDYGQRFAQVLQGTGLDFQPPAGPDGLRVVERLEGTKTTDFGAPDAMPARDKARLDGADLEHYEALLGAYWRAFAAAVSGAGGRELRKGPRGGGRDVEGIAGHVLNSEAAYLRSLGRKFRLYEGEPLNVQIDRIRQEELAALAAGARGELPTQGPRGGKIWPPRYFVRRAGWHVLDHLWEIEDRLL